MCTLYQTVQVFVSTVYASVCHQIPFSIYLPNITHTKAYFLGYFFLININHYYTHIHFNFDFLLFLKFKFIYFNWRLITLQYCIGFAIYQHESTTGVHMFPILNPPQTSVFNSFGYMPRHRMVWSQSNFRLNLLRKHQAVSIVAALLYSQQQYIRVPITPASSPTLVIFHFYDFVILVGVK